MAEIIQEDHGEKGGKKRPKKGVAHIDMTPMVDLMCLLITFFMLTTAFSKPKVMEITMPEKTTDLDKDKPQVKIPADRTYNILLTEKNGIFWYNGVIEKDKPVPTLVKSSFDDKSAVWIRKMLLQKNKTVFKQVAELKEKVTKGELIMADSTLNRKIKEIKKKDTKAPIFLIKANAKVKYKNMVDIIDEMAICNIGSYAVVDMEDQEQQLIDGTLK